MGSLKLSEVLEFLRIMGRGDIIMIQLKSVYSRVLTVQLFFEEVIDVSLLLIKQA